MRFLETECLCGFNLATAEPKEVLYREDKQPYAECPAGCGRTYIVTEEEAATSPVAETPEPTEPAETAEPTEPSEPEA